MDFQPLKIWICYEFYIYYAYLAILHCSIKNVHFGKKWQYVGTAFIYATIPFLGPTETYPFVSKTKCCDFLYLLLAANVPENSPMNVEPDPCLIPADGLSQFTEFSIHSWQCSSSDNPGALACLWVLSWVWCLTVGGCEKQENWWKGGSLTLQIMFNLWIMFRCECPVHKSCKLS